MVIYNFDHGIKNFYHDIKLLTCLGAINQEIKTISSVPN